MTCHQAMSLGKAPQNLFQTSYFVEMKFPAKKGFFDRYILNVLTLACMQSFLQIRKLYMRPVLSDKAFNPLRDMPILSPSNSTVPVGSGVFYYIE